MLQLYVLNFSAIKIKTKIVLTFVCISSFLYSQDPYYFTIGQTELVSANIYSVLESKSGNLYVGTDEGLYEYKYGQMQSLGLANEQIGTSVFGLVEGKDGTVFCFNLSGQIFKVNGAKLELYTQIDKEHIGNKIKMETTINEELLFLSKNCLLIKDGQIEVLLDGKDSSIRDMFKMNDGSIQFSMSNSMQKSIYNIDKELQISKLNKNDNELELNNSKLIENRLFQSSTLSKIAECKNCKLTHESKYSYENHYFGDGELWRRSNVRGIEYIFIEENSFKKQLLFQDRFISTTAKSTSKAMFFGTFGEGLIVVPNISNQSHNLGDDTIIPINILADEEGNVFLYSDDGRLYRYNENSGLRLISSIQLIDNIFLNPPSIFSPLENYPHLFFLKLTNSSLKDIVHYNDSTLLMATASGLMKLGDDILFSEQDWKRNPKQPELHTSIRFNERCNSISYNRKTNILYLATLSGLYKIDSSGASNSITNSGESIVASEIILHNDKLYSATVDNGLYIIEDDSILHHFNNVNGLSSNSLEHIEIYKDNLLIFNKGGLQLLNLNKLNFEAIGIDNGIPRGSLRDFSIAKDKLWFISKKKLYSIPMNLLNEKTNELSIRLDSILVSGNKIDINQSSKYTHKQSNFQFFIRTNNLLIEEDVIVHYKLEGLDNEWNTTDYRTEAIKYQYLPPGKYNFKVHNSHYDSKSKTVNYEFEVKKAIWNQSWFRMMMILSTIILFILWYRSFKSRAESKIDKQTLKAELLEKELIALRSQMNPHFIFNSLNSIQDLVLREHPDAAYDYIELFSDLIRRTLNYSNKKFIPLNQEIEYLKTYLELEKLRFDEDFHFNITNHADKDIAIPPLVIQPIVENAIKHGLFHKKGEKQLNIIFNKEEDYISCVVIDNGIGREKSEVNKVIDITHNPHAIASIKRRLNLLRKEHDSPIGLDIVDLKEGFKSNGTKAKIGLPYLNLHSS